MSAPGVRFTLEDSVKAFGEWRFNCGPAALCAVLDKTPEEIRPHLLDFESKGYTNPTLMAAILRGLGVNFRRAYECVHEVDGKDLFCAAGNFGLARIQWGGPWCDPGVPMAARYRQTHWVAYRSVPTNDAALVVREVFDVNAMKYGGWLPYSEWADDLVPWLIRECVKRGDGTWWPTHLLEVPRAERA